MLQAAVNNNGQLIGLAWNTAHIGHGRRVHWTETS